MTLRISQASSYKFGLSSPLFEIVHLSSYYRCNIFLTVYDFSLQVKRSIVVIKAGQTTACSASIESRRTYLA